MVVAYRMHTKFQGKCCIAIFENFILENNDKHQFRKKTTEIVICKVLPKPPSTIP